MKFKVLLYILLVCLSACFSACESLLEENYKALEQTVEGQDVYLSVSRAEAADTETINEDVVNYEDRVHDLALLIFDSSTGEKICEYFDNKIPLSDNEKAFTIKLTTGQRDFYFVANMPIATLKAINNRSEMIAYMDTFRELDISLYRGASVDRGFPMSRIYQNQTITEGGSIYSPKPFQPVTNGANEDRVKLIRAVAKLEVVLDGASINSGVKNIYYKNAYRQFGLTPEFYHPKVSCQESNLLEKVGNSYICYTPEAIMMSSNPVWSAVDHKPVNYLLIETLAGTFYEIPIITDKDNISGSDYMSFAKGQHPTGKPDYNIYRNRHYYYLIKKLQTLEIVYAIEPWIINENTTFMGYGYGVNIDEKGKVRISNMVNACPPHSVKIKTISPFTFDDGSIEKIFDNRNVDACAEYILKPIPQKGNGAYLKLYYNGAEVKTFSK